MPLFARMPLLHETQCNDAPIKPLKPVLSHFFALLRLAMLETQQTDSRAFKSILGNVSTHFKNTFKKTRILQREFWKMFFKCYQLEPSSFFRKLQKRKIYHLFYRRV